MKAVRYILLCAMLLFALRPDAAAQRPRRGKTVFSSTVVPKKVVAPDSLQLARRDSIARADSLYRVDSLALMKQSSLEKPAFSTARDSIVEVFSNGHRLIYYYGEVTVTYDDMKLSAERMEYDMNTGTVYAYGVYDSLSGEWKGRPVMEQGGKSYNMEELRYNFNSRRSKIKNMVTNEADGILHGQNIKMMPNRSFNITHGKYTVCDLEHPHYWLELSAAKVVTEPTQKTVFGPAHLVVEDVHLPFVALPFGFVPQRPKRATGLLMPTFGEENARGFYLKDLGMYFVFGDYFDLSVTTDIFTLGSWALDINSRYRVNYKFNGNFSLNYSNDQTGEKGSADFMQSTNFGLRWSHSQDSKAHPGTSFSASVNFSSPSNSRYNSRSVTEALQNQASSSVSWSHSWSGKANLSVNALHSQNSRDSSYAFTLPNVSFSIATFYPFKRKQRVGKEKVYEKFSLGYSTALQNKISFKMNDLKDYVLDSGGNRVIDPSTGVSQKEFGDSLGIKAMDRLMNGMAHNFSIGLPSFSLFKYFNINPSVSYGQNWMFSSGRQYLEGVTDDTGAAVMVNDSDGNSVQAQRVVTDPGTAFNAFGITHTYSGSVSMNTRLYGMFNFGKFHRIQAIRHVVSPSLSMSFSPDKATYFNGWRDLPGYYDKNGTYHAASRYNIYNLTGGHNTVSAPGPGKSATASLSIGNNLEAKVRDFADSTGAGSKKVKLIDQLSLNTGYNFLAEQFKMSNISASMSTSIFGKLSLSASAAFDPYAIDEKGVRVDRFAIKEGQGPARFTNGSASMSYALSGKGSIKGNDGSKTGGPGASSGPADYYRRIYTHPVTGEYIPGGWLYYTNPDVPWSVNFSYSLSYSRSYRYDTAAATLLTDNLITQTLNVSGNMKLTPKMSLNASSGFDLQARKVTTTQISATYDLHCFNIAVSLVPTGMWKSYSFRIAANAAALSDLLRFKKSSSYWDN
ncbi:MAG: LPS-assembly protein LptD [Bacteroidales bacterium]|nr:LPS-assembly protein LptD [Bacteroidales bacterium]